MLHISLVLQNYTVVLLPNCIKTSSVNHHTPSDRRGFRRRRPTSDYIRELLQYRSPAANGPDGEKLVPYLA